MAAHEHPHQPVGRASPASPEPSTASPASSVAAPASVASPEPPAPSAASPATAAPPTRRTRTRPHRHVSRHTPLADLRTSRLLHPAAWWAWALCLAVVASRTTNPLLLALLVAVLALVVAERRTAGPWSRAFVVMLRVGLLLIALKVVVAVLLTGVGTGPVWLRLPAVPMPDWLVGLRLGGPVHADVVLAALYDGLRLAAILACVGAANALVVPSRLLRALPAALYEVGVAVVISMTVLPMLVADLGRVREARRLRGRDTGRITAAAQMALPVLNGALDRAVSLAAAMDSRGYGRAGAVPRRVRLVTSTAVVVGLAGVALGVYGVLDGGAPGVAGVSLLGWPAVVAGCTLAVAAALLARRRVGRSVYRPDPWRLPEVLVVATGLVAVVAVVTTQAAGVAGLEAPLGPPWWPALPALPTLGLLAALLAIPASPPLPWQHRPDRLPASAPRRPALTATAGEAT